MNKQTYITPEMEIMNIETVEMMATSGIAVVNESGDEMLGTERRSSWGDLWNGE